MRSGSMRRPGTTVPAARPIVRGGPPYDAPSIPLEVIVVSRLRLFFAGDRGLATVEYIIGAAVVLGTLVIGVSAWNNGLVSRLQALVSDMQAVR